MTNSIAIGLIVTLAAFLALDHFVLHLDALPFMIRKLIDLINYLAIWR